VLSRMHGLTVPDIDRIRVVGCRYVSGLPNYPEPTNGLETKFSAEHAAAVAMIDQAGGVEQFSDERAVDPQVVELRRRTSLEFDDALADYQLRLHLITRDGREYSHFVPHQKGDYRNPLTAEEIETKFRANASVVLPSENVDALVRLLNDLESIDDVGQLTRLCRPGLAE
jgi:2-methylcitrate dehydratase PrpD